MHRLVTNNHGFSMILNLVAGALAASIFLITQSVVFNASDTISKTQGRLYCQDMVDSSLNNLRGLGPASLIQALPLGGTAIQAIQPLPGVNPADRWPTANSRNVVTAAPNQRPVVANYQTIEGSMSTLNAILNSRQDAQGNRFCESPQGGRYVSPSGPQLFVETAIQGYVGAPTTMVRVQLVDLVTGQLSCPPSYPLFLRPPGNGISPYVQADPRSTDRFGFQVTVTSSYQDLKAPQNEPRRECSSSARFIYPKLQDDGLNQLSVQVQVIPPSTRPVCATRRATGRATITFNAPNPDQRGTVLLCKDNSISIPGPAACDDGSGARPETFATDTSFQPCAIATLCGRAPTNVVRNGNQLIVDYTNLPWGCEAHMSAIAVDPGLNASSQPIADAGAAQSSGSSRQPASRRQNNNGVTSIFSGGSALGTQFADVNWFTCHQPSCACGGYSGCARGGCYPCPPPPPPPVASSSGTPAPTDPAVILVNCVSTNPASPCPSATVGGGCGGANPSLTGSCVAVPLSDFIASFPTGTPQSAIDQLVASQTALGTIGTVSSPPRGATAVVPVSALPQ